MPKVETFGNRHGRKDLLAKIEKGAIKIVIMMHNNPLAGRGEAKKV